MVRPKPLTSNQMVSPLHRSFVLRHKQPIYFFRPQWTGALVKSNLNKPTDGKFSTFKQVPKYLSTYMCLSGMGNNKDTLNSVCNGIMARKKFKHNIHQVFENKSLLPDSHSKCVDVFVKLI